MKAALLIFFAVLMLHLTGCTVQPTQVDEDRICAQIDRAIVEWNAVQGSTNPLNIFKRYIIECRLCRLGRELKETENALFRQRNP
jgi:hypothetical protein